MRKQLNIKDFLVPVLAYSLLFGACQKQPEQHDQQRPLPSDKIILSEAQIQLANIKVTEIREGEIGSDLLLTGIVKVNQHSAVNIAARSAGRIQKLYFKNTGEKINQGDSIYQIYSEELVAAEREYFTLQHNNWNASGRYEPSLVLENKLLYLGVLPSQITQLKKDGRILFTVTIHSPAGGTIRSINCTENQYVDAGQVLFELADNQKLWVEALVYPNDLPLLKLGLPTLVTIPSAGNKILQSGVSFISPSIEPGTNAALIRCDIDNPGNNIYPGMFAQIRVRLQEKSGIVIPSSAIITDKNGTHVWVQHEDGSFSSKDVMTDTESEDSVLIVTGLEGIKKVVTSGVYLLNSEFILKNGTSVQDKQNETVSHHRIKEGAVPMNR